MRSLADQLQPLHISVTPTNTGNNSTAETSLSPAPSSSAKWACLVCTYVNWPRSLRCVLCSTVKGQNVPDPLVSLAGAPEQRIPDPTPARDSPSPEGASMRRLDASSAMHSLENRRNLSRQSSDNKIDILSQQGLENSSELIRHSTDIKSGLVRRASENKRTNQADTNDADNQSLDNRLTSLAESRDRWTPDQSGSGSGSVAGAAGSNNLEYEKRLRQLRRRMRETDWAWVSACMGVVEGDICPVEAYLNSGGDPTRKLTQGEAGMLGRPGIFEPGHTLVHLAIKYHREDLLATLLSQMEGLSNPAVKRVPSYVAPDLAAAIRRQLALSLRHRKGGFPCFYLSDCATYTLPPELEDLPRNVQEQLYNELLDKDAKAELESELCINWSEEITNVLGSRLFPLWNRSAGDCLLDAALQATWGVFDRDNMLRRALADSLTEAGHVFNPRWKEWETRQAQELGFSLADSQWDSDWADLLSLAGQPGASLEQTHIFCLAHVLRRPIIVYGVKYVKSWRGENLGYAKFEGVYLPLLWDPGFCYRSPIALGYTRGHFCALVPPEPDLSCGGAGGGAAPLTPPTVCAYLPLVSREQEMLPLHFTSRGEVGREEEILKQWMDVGITEAGIMVAQQTIARPPLLVAQMTEEWLNYYRKIAQSTSAPVAGRSQLSARIELESSEESTDDD
ncbi:ubiquitin thioesterase trabid [Eurytemora carolleeae]|uniref:ubiquitin thioesterase trabid n=1 Tax=Eurytemora carolleeae TaxID=1294199 RepID=UPI000C785303|nr:ubiquitin thioesterase trabid [Eurytemora carolleeae]XP_023339440.1 ubiquitin thioesterase trabid [Eurytemora carolleeae]XP_023339441.1 ubiquitin thioesterase trabid [Eurytemora carolleeae]|eukprot:XP_023339439.1 ubiquitin thioesterase trabid-like [Eurytemora affinis]